MVSYKTVSSLVEPPDNKRELIKNYQQTHDIIKDVVYCFKNYNYQAEPVRDLFFSGDVKRDGKKIYDFIRDNINYKAESTKDQTTRSFSRIIFDKWGDCKHSALIVGCLGWQMGYDVIFKFVAYDKRGIYGHVYTILRDPETKEKIVVDPLQEFNHQKNYLDSKNYIALQHPKEKNMALSRLSGTGDNDDRNGLKVVGNIKCGELTMISENDIAGIGKSKAKKAIEKVKEKLKEHGGAVKTVALAPVRAATQVLFLINFRGFASRLKKVNEINPSLIDGFVKKFGFVKNNFLRDMEKGATKKPFLGEKVSGEYGEMEIQGIGVVSTAAAITAASPAIVAIVDILKKAGLNLSSDDQTASQAEDDAKNLPDVAAGEGKDVQKSAEKKDVDNAKGFFEKVADSVKDHPVWWFGGATVLVFIGNKVIKMRK